MSLWESIKNNIIYILGLITTGLLVILKLDKKKIETLQLENATLRTEKELGDVSNEAKKSREEYNKSKSDYDDFKRKHSGSFGKKPNSNS